MLQAKSNLSYPVQAFTGRQYVKYEWRPVPAGCEDEARRLASKDGGSVLLLQEDTAVDFKVPAGLPDDMPLTVNINSDAIEIEPAGTAVVEKANPFEGMEDAEPVLAVDLDGKTIVELKEMAKAAGITIGRKSKAELIAALRDD